MLQQIKWLWENMEKKYRIRHVIALIISVVTSAMLLVNPALTQRLVDDVIVAENPEPLLPILMVMLFAKLLREGLRYFMVISLEKARKAWCSPCAASCFPACSITICAFLTGCARAI